MTTTDSLKSKKKRPCIPTGGKRRYDIYSLMILDSKCSSFLPRVGLANALDLIPTCTCDGMDQQWSCI